MELTRNRDYELVKREDVVLYLTQGRNFSILQIIHIDWKIYVVKHNCIIKKF